MTILFVIFLLLLYYLHMACLHVDVLFYAVIADSCLATLVGGALLFTTPYFRFFNPFERTQLLIIWLMLGYAFAISIPTVIDRSLSFYILEKLQQRGGGIKQNYFGTLFTKEYVKEYHLVAIRLTEQEQSGTLQIKNGCVKLTRKGRKLAAFSRMFRQYFLPKQRLLMGKYSDMLTHPLRASSTHFDYQC